MTRLRRKLMTLSERYHEYWHLMFGVISSVLVIRILSPEYPLIIIGLGLIMSLLPDIDHIFYFYIYGRRTKYSKDVRKLISKGKFAETIDYCKKNHKNNTSIYSHNLLIFSAVSYWAYYELNLSLNPILAVIALSWSSHYFYDILEDLLFFKKLNPNWYLLFNTKRK